MRIVLKPHNRKTAHARHECAIVAKHGMASQRRTTAISVWSLPNVASISRCACARDEQLPPIRCKRFGRRRYLGVELDTVGPIPGATAPRQQMRRRGVCSMHGVPEKHGELGEVDDIDIDALANLGEQLGGASIVDRPCRQLQRRRMQPVGHSTPIGRAQLGGAGGCTSRAAFCTRSAGGTMIGGARMACSSSSACTQRSLARGPPYVSSVCSEGTSETRSFSREPASFSALHPIQRRKRLSTRNWGGS